MALLKEIRVMAVCGFLGYGFPVESLEAGLAGRPHVIGVDSGSTDPGPYYLGSGSQLIKKPQMVRDLGLSLAAARKTGVPYVIGSAGTAGGDPHVDSVLEVLYEVAKRDGHRFKLAVIRSEIEKNSVKQAIRGGRIRSMGKLPTLTEEDVNQSVRIVGQMGVGPFIKAFEAGAEVIIAGRSCDTAIYASMAVMKGYDLGLAYHMGKIIECGAMCATPANGCDGIMATLRDDHFELEPLNPHRRLSPTSVAAHMMYEQPDPYVFYEPEGMVDLRDTEMEQVDDRHVRVRGTRFIPASTQ
ncbi:MAG: acyclic terpene utilization AtuA family protein, partial [Dehalococcoidia bacterium]|nr:acyclic terpene utilization AtuA family protein [Dehalococcoidia bacterium]